MVPSTEHILRELKNRGERLTLVRRALVEILSSVSRPLTSLELEKMLAKKKLAVNKTTVYRQLESLAKNKIIQEIRFNDRSKRYELALFGPSSHHHHAVCLSCGSITDVSFREDIERQEKSIAESKGFTVTEHRLEFFGFCQTCQKKKRK